MRVLMITPAKFRIIIDPTLMMGLKYPNTKLMMDMLRDTRYIIKSQFLKPALKLNVERSSFGKRGKMLQKFQFLGIMSKLHILDLEAMGLMKTG